MRRIMALGLLVALTAGPTRGEEMTLSVHDVTVVQDGEGHARILFRVDPFATSDSLHVDRAVLTVRYAGAAEDRSLELRVCPLMGMVGGADWYTPFEEEFYARSDWNLRSESGILRFDLTGAFRALRAQGTPVDGFVLTTAGFDSGLATEDVSRFSGLLGSSVQLTTSRLPSGMPPRTYRDRHTG